MQSSSQYLFITALLFPSWSIATTIHRCEAANGQITFTTLSCAIGESYSRQELQTFTPSNMTALMPEAEPRNTPVRTIKRREPVVAGQTEDKCGNLISAAERRAAIMSKRIIAGMSPQDVESALGKPDQISIRNSSTRYRYDSKRGRSAQIEFDERGCTKGKAKSQTAKSPH
ncbi:cell envelope protein SmpA [Pseudomonas putida]|uniref:Cell envelope protein SmpA n=1 Tax=Pseudomonas putida TaxID=303 RepID=A0A2Z4RIL3_PSEPU|nr:cell envelope protein SmpA [Pseudomonas putida]AWY40796.1 cell envelope protein SmpA [Pseudomonas putida]